MLTDLSPRERGNLMRLAAHLKRLSTDLVEIAGGRGPRPEDLADAPTLDEYVVAEKTLPCLVGVQSGHPSVTGSRIQTSEMYVLDERSGWARTLSRYYRLGRPLLATLGVRGERA